MCELTLDEIEALKELNQLLTHIQIILKHQWEVLTAKAARRYEGIDIQAQFSKAVITATYFLRKDDFAFNHRAKHVIALRAGIFGAQMLEAFDWAADGAVDTFGFDQHCWLFNQLYAPVQQGFPVSIVDLLRIGDIHFILQFEGCEKIDLSSRQFCFRYTHPYDPAWETTRQLSYTGNYLPVFPETPKQNDFRIEDIIQGLSHQCKFLGQTRFFYSFAQHSLLVASLLPDELKPAALLGLAQVAYAGEIGHFVQGGQANLRRYEERLRSAIGNRFGIARSQFEESALLSARSRVELTERRDVLFDPYFCYRSKERRLLTHPIISLAPQEVKTQLTIALQKYLPNAFL
ncbi:hypothetical protein [Undibacterium danionis]|uniref:FRG domain-containing protein n=1 Tax=Undibacterium danionis TaxID=1812100 RepID=A0ABV6IBS1_9BURK